MLIDPLGVVNDGVNELMLITSKITSLQMVKFMDQMVKQGGIQGYDKNVCHLRGRTSKVVSKLNRTQANTHPFGVDGESLFFSNFVKYEVEHEGLEVIVDFERIMESQGHFKK